MDLIHSVVVIVLCPVDNTQPPSPPPLSHPTLFPVSNLRDLGGPEVPESWRGGLNITYRIGPLASGRQVRMNISTRNSIRRAENVIGIIKGAVEPGELIGRLGWFRDKAGRRRRRGGGTW